MSESSREEAFTTIRITKRDRELLNELALPRENTWETFRRVAQAAAVTLIKKKETAPRKSLSDKYKRIVNNIERGFIAYRKQGVEQVSFGQLKDWVNSNTKDGISSPRLANVLRRRPQFHLVRRERKQGSNRIHAFWAFHYGHFDEVPKGKTPDGWVEIPILADTGMASNE